MRLLAVTMFTLLESATIQTGINPLFQTGQGERLNMKFAAITLTGMRH
jgi:hypothetical protein